MLLPVGPLPDDPIAAAAAFHGEWLARITALLDGGAQVLTLVFAPAPHGHSGWREAAVQLLARERTPARINAIVANSEAAIAAIAAFVDGAPGLTGQVLVADGNGGGGVIYPPA